MQTFMKIILPGFLTLILISLTININAADTTVKNETIEESAVQAKFKDYLNDSRKGFIKRIVKKIKEGTKKVYRKSVNKIKRIFSKQKSKKNRMRTNFKDRKSNLFNILLFSLLFIAAAALIVFASLYLYLNLGLILGLYLLYVLGIVLLISALVISLIYFSNRFVLKPKFRS